ncbi:hypothetical protein VRRI112168_19015 [Vreelandella rituensis]
MASVVKGYDREVVLGQKSRLLRSGHHLAPFYKNMWDSLPRGEIFRDSFIGR